MKENYLALLLSIVTEMSADEALIKIGALKRKTGNPGIWKGIKLDKLINLYEKGLTYNELANYFKTSINAIAMKLYDLRKKGIIDARRLNR